MGGSIWRRVGESSGSSGGVIGEGFGEGIFISSSESENLKQIKQLITKICQHVSKTNTPNS